MHLEGNEQGELLLSHRCGYWNNVLIVFLIFLILESRSALDIILEGQSSKHLDMLQGGVIQKLLEEKWKAFGQVLNTNEARSHILFHSACS